MLPKLIAVFVFAAWMASSAISFAQGGAEVGSFESLEAFEAAARFAENAFVYGDYPDVVSTLEGLLSGPVDGAEEGALVRAFTLLGTSAHFTGRGDLADAAFLRALRLDPRLRLDPLVVPPRVIERFEAVRAANAVELDALIADASVAATVYIERSVREQSRLVSMMPFGYGFFSSDRDGLGAGYLIGEVATGSAMVALYLSNEIARDESGFFANPARARARATAQLASAGTFLGLLAVNVVHGLVSHQDSTRVRYRTLTEPPAELRDGGAPSSRGWRVGFAPIFPRGH